MAKPPEDYAREVRGQLKDLKDRAREIIGEVNDPHAEALFETTAEVLGGLEKACEHFAKRSEEAWK